MGSIFSCFSCGSFFGKRKNTKDKYCSNLCQNKYQSEEIVNNWLTGKIVGYVGKTRQLRKPVRDYLLKLYNNTYQVCGWNDFHPIDNRPLVEIDHIDGDAENCNINNLRVLCPNCHSKTPTFRSRNKNSKRNRKSPN